MRYACTLISVMALAAATASAQQSPFFVTSDHRTGDRHDLGLSTESNTGFRRQEAARYMGQLFKIEYAVTPWWAASLHFESASHPDDRAVFTGVHFENRFRLLQSEHAINPGISVEYAATNAASRIQGGIVGHSEKSEDSVSDLRRDRAGVLAGKLVLFSNVKGWSIAENILIERNLSADQNVSFGYALGAFRPLSPANGNRRCRWCADSISLGIEFYGGLGDTARFGMADTAQYAAPVFVWNFGKNQALKVSPGFGLTSGSDRLLRFGYSYDIGSFGPKIPRLLGMLQ